LPLSPGQSVISLAASATRLELLQCNAIVFREVVPEVLTKAPDAVLVVATNPVYVLSYMAVMLNVTIPSNGFLSTPRFL
jgi:L-lactate dehydrogenase